MIKVNNKEIEIKHFPDGTQMLLDFNIEPYFDIGGGLTETIFEFDWTYSNDEELVTLIYLAKHCRDKYPDCYMSLRMLYVPNARMDRVNKPTEVFTLKYFCEIINSLNFNRIYVRDPHSNVSKALLNHLVVKDPDAALWETIADIRKKEVDLVIYFPDAGAMDRYSKEQDLTSLKSFEKFYGRKRRNKNTGIVEGIDLFNKDGERVTGKKCLEGKAVLMVDDIISYGGTLAYSADMLKDCGAEKIFAFATHTENSVLNREKGTLIKRLDNGTVNRIYTTTSVFTGKNEKITVWGI